MVGWRVGGNDTWGEKNHISAAVPRDVFKEARICTEISKRGEWGEKRMHKGLAGQRKEAESESKKKSPSLETDAMRTEAGHGKG